MGMMRVLFKNRKDQTLFLAEIKSVKYDSILEELTFISATGDKVTTYLSQAKAEAIIRRLYKDGCYDLSSGAVIVNGGCDNPDAHSEKPCRVCGYVMDIDDKTSEEGFVKCPRCKTIADLSLSMEEETKQHA